MIRDLIFNRRTLLRLLAGAAVISGLLPAAAREKREVLPVPDWTGFNGARWGELTLGETTLGAFTQRYSSRDTDTPGLLLATTRSRANSRIYTVFSGAGPEARLEWVAHFPEGGKPLAPEALLQQYGSDYAERFPETRALDWRLWVFPKRGVAAVVARGRDGESAGDAARVAGFLFAPPPRMALLAQRLPQRETPLAPRDEREEEPLVARLGRISVSASRDGDINFDRDRLENTAEFQVQLGLAQDGAVVYDRDADGRASITVRVRRRPDRDGKRRVTVDVSSSITAEGPYGEVTGSGSASREIEGDTTSGRIRSRAVDAAEEATDEAADSVRWTMQRQRSEARQAFVRGQMLELTKLLLRAGRRES